MTEAGSQDHIAHISVPERHAIALSNLAKLPQPTQQAIYRAASELPTSTQPWDSLQAAISTILDGSRDDARALTAAFVGMFYARQRASDKNDSEFVQAATNGILKAVTGKKSAKASDLQAVLVNVLALKNLEASHHAGRVRFDHAYHFHDATIISDIRPIFDRGGSLIEGAVVSHVLKIDYASTSEDDNKLYVAVDADDLDKLEAAIQRARRKEIALMKFAKGAKLKIIGDEK